MWDGWVDTWTDKWVKQAFRIIQNSLQIWKPNSNCHKAKRAAWLKHG